MFLLLPLSTGQIIDMGHLVWVIVIVIACNLYMLRVSLWHFYMTCSGFGLNLRILVKRVHIYCAFPLDLGFFNTAFFFLEREVKDISTVKTGTVTPKKTTSFGQCHMAPPQFLSDCFRFSISITQVPRVNG